MAKKFPASLRAKGAPPSRLPNDNDADDQVAPKTTVKGSPSVAKGKGPPAFMRKGK